MVCLAGRSHGADLGDSSRSLIGFFWPFTCFDRALDGEIDATLQVHRVPLTHPFRLSVRYQPLTQSCLT